VWYSRGGKAYGHSTMAIWQNWSCGNLVWYGVWKGICSWL
jgi:hypothetical protein